MKTTQVFHIIGDLFDIPRKILVIDGQTPSPVTGRPIDRDGRLLSIYHSISDMFALLPDDVIRRLLYFMTREGSVVVYHGQSLQPHLVGKCSGVDNLIMTLSADSSDPQHVNDLVHAYNWNGVYATVHQDPPEIVDYDDDREIQSERKRCADLLKVFLSGLSTSIKVVDRPDVIIVDAVFNGMSVDDQLQHMEVDDNTVRFVQNVLKNLPDELSERDDISIRTADWNSALDVAEYEGAMVAIPLNEGKVISIYRKGEDDLLSVWMTSGTESWSTHEVKLKNLTHLMDWIRVIEDGATSWSLSDEDYKAGCHARRAALRVGLQD